MRVPVKGPPNLVQADSCSLDRLFIHIYPVPAEEAEAFGRPIYERRRIGAGFRRLTRYDVRHN